MNIVVLSHRVPFPPNKGEKIRTYNQLEFLSRRGFNITVFCLLHEPGDEEHAAEYRKSADIEVVTEKIGLSKLRMLGGLLRLRSLSVANFYCVQLQKKLDAHLAGSAVDVIYSTSSSMAEYVIRGGRKSTARSKPRMVIDFMDLDSDKWRQYASVNRFPMSWVYRYEARILLEYEKKIQQYFDQCIFISSNEVALFKKRLAGGTDNLNVVGNGVDLTQFRPPASMVFKKPLTLLFSGVMDYFPNENAMCWFVDNVWPGLKLLHPDARLVIAGMNPGSTIMDMAKDEQITVTGYVDDMLACYHEANVFIAPFQIARGVQNKILQAFACGLPVVSSVAGAEGIDCVHGEHLLIAETPEQYIEKIDQLVRDNNTYENICNSALKLVHQNYTWDAKNECLAELFKELR